MEEILPDKILLNIAMTVAFISLLGLFVYMYFNPIPLRNIQDLNLSDLDKNIKIMGVVKDISRKNQTVTIKLGQECSINVISFDNISEINNTHIIVQGKFQDPGKKYLIADSIKILK